jgi:hypothetical protein
MPELARIPRRTRTPEHTLPPPPGLPVSLLFCPNPSECRPHCLTTAPAAQISRLRGNRPRRYHRPRSPQLRLRPRRNCSDPPLALSQRGRTYDSINARRRTVACLRTELSHSICNESSSQGKCADRRSGPRLQKVEQISHSKTLAFEVGRVGRSCFEEGPVTSNAPTLQGVTLIHPPFSGCQNIGLPSNNFGTRGVGSFSKNLPKIVKKSRCERSWYLVRNWCDIFVD